MSHAYERRRKNIPNGVFGRRQPLGSASAIDSGEGELAWMGGWVVGWVGLWEGTGVGMYVGDPQNEMEAAQHSPRRIVAAKTWIECTESG